MKYLDKKGIETRPLFYPFNQSAIYKKFLKKKDGNYANSLFFFKRGLSLPTFYGIKDSEIKHICNLINKFFYEKK